MNTKNLTKIKEGFRMGYESDVRALAARERLAGMPRRFSPQYEAEIASAAGLAAPILGLWGNMDRKLCIGHKELVLHRAFRNVFGI